jgi:hypothetical protein
MVSEVINETLSHTFLQEKEIRHSKDLESNVSRFYLINFST